MPIYNLNSLSLNYSNSDNPVFIFSRCALQFFFGLLFIILCQFGYAGTIDTVTIPSAAMEKQPKALIILPDEYQTDINFHYPSVYLLHGWSGRFSDWNDHIDLTHIADRFEMIIICPDGGYSGWYLDSPYRADSQYETYIIKEVLPFIQEHYRATTDPEQRFICGLSMGGYGALRLISRFPELFAAAGSMSGVLQFNSDLDRYGLIEILGDSLSNSRSWHENACINLLSALFDKSKGIIIDCGVDDPFIGMNRAVHTRLLDIGLDHDYWERPGAHSWTYWTHALEYHLLYFQKLFRNKN